jgi:hypothetical protein
MKRNSPGATCSIVELFGRLLENERIITDVLRQIILETMPGYCREKISFNVPFFYHKKGICIIWPASVPRGGVREGVLLGFWQGNKLADKEHYLSPGTNKKVFFHVKLYYIRCFYRYRLKRNAT